MEDLQLITDRFADAAQKYGLSVNLKKTEVMFQPTRGKPYADSLIRIGDTRLKAVTKFCYLGSTLSNNALIDEEVTSQIHRACVSFGRLPDGVEMAWYQTEDKDKSVQGCGTIEPIIWM